MLRRAPVLLGLCLLGAVSGRLSAAEPEGFRLIVHPELAVDGLDKRFVARAFLKKAQHWPDGSIIRPVDLTMKAVTRETFSREVLERSVSAVKSYWEQLIFSGNGVPPPELDTDEAVVQYVLSHPGSIGYVSAKASVTGVRVVPLK